MLQALFCAAGEIPLRIDCKSVVTLLALGPAAAVSYRRPTAGSRAAIFAALSASLIRCIFSSPHVSHKPASATKRTHGIYLAPLNAMHGPTFVSHRNRVRGFCGTKTNSYCMRRRLSGTGSVEHVVRFGSASGHRRCRYVMFVASGRLCRNQDGHIGFG